jgi:hypothetical protein
VTIRALRLPRDPASTDRWSGRSGPTSATKSSGPRTDAYFAGRTRNGRPAIRSRQQPCCADRPAPAFGPRRATRLSKPRAPLSAASVHLEPARRCLAPRKRTRAALARTRTVASTVAQATGSAAALALGAQSSHGFDVASPASRCCCRTDAATRDGQPRRDPSRVRRRAVNDPGLAVRLAPPRPRHQPLGPARPRTDPRCA